MSNGSKKQKLVTYKLRALPSRKYNFVKIDSDNPGYAEMVVGDKAEAEIRALYRSEWNLSDAEIDERLRVAQKELEELETASRAS